MAYTNNLTATNLASIIGSAIGAFGASVVVLSCYRYQKLSRTLSRKLIASQSLAHLTETLSILFLPSTHHSTCLLQGVVEEYAVYCGLFWGCLMTYLLILLTRKSIGNVAAFQSERFLLQARLIGWILPLPLALVPLLTEDYARDSGGWCWFKDSTASGRFFRFFHYSVVFLCVGFVSISSLHIYRRLSHTFPSSPLPVETLTPFQFPLMPSPLPSPSSDVSPPSPQDSDSDPTSSAFTFPAALSPLPSTASWRRLPTSISRRLQVTIPEARTKLSNRLIYFPLVLLVCYCCLTLHRFWDLIGSPQGSSPPDLLLVIGIALARCQVLFPLSPSSDPSLASAVAGSLRPRPLLVPAVCAERVAQRPRLSPQLSASALSSQPSGTSGVSEWGPFATHHRPRPAPLLLCQPSPHPPCSEHR
jgi:hypothetical protein